MIDRTQFVGPSDPNIPFPISSTCTVPTEQMATMLAKLLATSGRVLEIGTGSGYQAAILAEQCEEVLSLEVQPLNNVSEKLPANVTLITADGCTYDSGEQFDGILVTFAAERIVEPWFKQLKEDGRLVVPLKHGSICRICVYQKQDGGLKLIDVPAYASFTYQIWEVRP